MAVWLDAYRDPVASIYTTASCIRCPGVPFLPFPRHPHPKSVLSAIKRGSSDQRQKAPGQTHSHSPEIPPPAALPSSEQGLISDGGSAAPILHCRV